MLCVGKIQAWKQWANFHHMNETWGSSWCHCLRPHKFTGTSDQVFQGEYLWHENCKRHKHTISMVYAKMFRCTEHVKLTGLDGRGDEGVASNSMAPVLEHLCCIMVRCHSWALCCSPVACKGSQRVEKGEKVLEGVQAANIECTRQFGGRRTVVWRHTCACGWVRGGAVSSVTIRRFEQQR
jgi:hypothetical protein